MRQRNVRNCFKLFDVEHPQAGWLPIDGIDIHDGRIFCGEEALKTACFRRNRDIGIATVPEPAEAGKAAEDCGAFRRICEFCGIDTCLQSAAWNFTERLAAKADRLMFSYALACMGRAVNVRSEYPCNHRYSRNPCLLRLFTIVRAFTRNNWMRPSRHWGWSF